MSLAFFPSRENMMKEVQQWIVLRKLDMLQSLCNCCVYKTFDCTMSRDCRSCNVRAGIHTLVDDERTAVECDELLNIC